MHFVRKVPEDGSDRFYIISCEWEEDDFSIFVISNDRAWNGKLCLSDAHVEPICKMLGKSVQDYFAELKKGLSSDTDGQFCFLLEHESFLVKKKDLITGMKVRYCCIPLEEYPTIAAYNSILNIAIEKLEQYSNEKKSLQDEVLSLKSEKEDLVKNLDLLAQIKNSMENIFYGKFLKVLNAKKAHLVEDALAAERELGLGQSLPAQPENSREVGKNATSSKQKRVIENTLNELQSDEDRTSSEFGDNHYNSETEIDTEDELMLDVKGRTEKEILEVPSDSSAFLVQPSTSKISSESILPKRGNRRKVNTSDETKKMREIPPNSAEPSERILPKRMKRDPETPAHTSSSQDYANSDTILIPAVNFSISDSEEEQLQDSTVMLPVPAADPTTKPSDQILPKRTKRGGKQTSKDSLSSVARCESINNLVFDSQSLLNEFD